MDRCAKTTRDSCGSIGAMVSDNVYRDKLGRVIESVDALEEPPDHEFLFVCGDKDREASCRCALLSCLWGPAKAGNGQDK